MKNHSLFYSFLIMAIILFASFILKFFSIQIFALEFEVCILYFPTAALFLTWLFNKKRKN
jgi:small neutral amino acid transporter SnatA (MarC family)